MSSRCVKKMHLLQLKPSCNNTSLLRDKSWECVGSIESPDYESSIVINGQKLEVFSFTQPSETPCATCMGAWVFQAPEPLVKEVDVPKTHALLSGLLLQHPIVIALPVNKISEAKVCKACAALQARKPEQIRSAILDAFSSVLQSKEVSAKELDVDGLQDDAEDVARNLSSNEPPFPLASTSTRSLRSSVFERSTGLYHFQGPMPTINKTIDEEDQSSYFSDDEDSTEIISIRTTDSTIVSADSKYD